MVGLVRLCNLTLFMLCICRILQPYRCSRTHQNDPPRVFARTRARAVCAPAALTRRTAPATATPVIGTILLNFIRVWCVKTSKRVMDSYLSFARPHRPGRLSLDVLQECPCWLSQPKRRHETPHAQARPELPCCVSQLASCRLPR